MAGDILVTGFGPFGELLENPSGALARAVDGRQVQGVRVRGLELPVSYTAAPGLTAEAAKGVRLVVGLGVAQNREGVQVERRAHGRPVGLDVNGVCPEALFGPKSLETDVDVEAFAAALGGTVSLDAGSYVCNAWLYTALRDLDVPAVFVHIADADALSADRLVSALEVLL